MSPLSLVLPKKVSEWRKIQRDNFTSIESLLAFLEISAEKREKILKQPKFVLNVPLRLASKMQKDNLDDPIFRQFVPLTDELLEAPGFVQDPVQDISFKKEKKIIHKYHGRALLISSSACAMHCRYCFRQNFPYESSSKSFDSELEYLKAHSEISEIILSGGDPLSLNNETISNLFLSLEQIQHIQRIRFHTRFPIGIPERIDEELLTLLRSSSKQIFFIIHCNHPLEIDPDVTHALKQIAKLGIPILNQSVLLKGVNDDEKTLLNLSETLVNIGVTPYYIHLLDPVSGTTHFAVPKERGLELIESLKSKTSGYAIPRLAQEEPGKTSKTFI